VKAGERPAQKESTMFPLLDLDADLQECEAILRDMDTTIQNLLLETEGRYPPGGPQFRQGVARMLAALAILVPADLREAIGNERAESDAEPDRWEPSSY
jgi:hypothetical protein